MSDEQDLREEQASSPQTPDALPAGQRSRKAAARPEVTKRLKRRNGRFYLDLRDLGKGREALIPEGQSYATKDELVAIHLAGLRLAEVLVPEHERHFNRSELTRMSTIGQFTREWLVYARSVAGEGYAKSRTILRYEQAFGQLFRALDQDVRMDRVTTSDIKRAIQALRQTRTRSGGFTSASSLHQIITGMQRVYDHASDEGVVPSGYNPWRDLRRQDRPSLPRQSSTDFLENYEAHALLQGCADWPLTVIPLQALASTYLHTGGRKAEVLGLEVDDVDFRRKLIRFRPNRWRDIKDYDERSVPLWPALERDLRRHLDERPRTSTLVFEGRDAVDRPQMITSYHKAFMHARAAAAARLGDILGKKLLAKAINPRVLRVTYCSARLQTLDRGQPISPYTVESELGHNSGKMIRRVYGRIGEVRHRSDVVEYLSFEALQSLGPPDPDLESTSEHEQTSESPLEEDRRAAG